MNKTIKRFVLCSTAAVFVLLTALLAVINGINFTMASDDADRITQAIADHGGVMDSGKDEWNAQQFDPERQRFGPMGPDSPDVNNSIRYFTFRINEDGSGETVAFRMSAVSEKEALEWAKTLSSENTGWTHGTYRYRVYELKNRLYVTVIDQARELLPIYRILTISFIGEAICLIISFFVLSFVGKRLFAPVEEADRKQRRFIAAAESEFKLPLTVINANTELIEKDSGVTDRTTSIHRQVRKMAELVKTLGEFAVVEEKDMQKSECDLSALFGRAIDSKKSAFEERGVTVESSIENGIVLKADRDAMDSVVRELVENARNFALSRAAFSLRRENDRIVLTASNDADISAENVDQVFDRFTRLENAKGKEGAGLGLSHVKDAVKVHSGRARASYADGVFTIRIDL